MRGISALLRVGGAFDDLGRFSQSRLKAPFARQGSVCAQSHASVLRARARMPRLQRVPVTPAPATAFTDIRFEKRRAARFGWFSNISHKHGRRPLVGQQRLPAGSRNRQPDPAMWSGHSHRANRVFPRVELEQHGDPAVFVIPKKLPVIAQCDLIEVENKFAPQVPPPGGPSIASTVAVVFGIARDRRLKMKIAVGFEQSANRCGPRGFVDYRWEWSVGPFGSVPASRWSFQHCHWNAATFI